MSKFGSFISALAEGASKALEETQRQREAEKKRLFLYTKKEFDQVMNENIENKEVFGEGCKIIGEYRYYTQDTVMQNMQNYIAKYKTGKIE
jgi:hypothetical protein